MKFNIFLFLIFISTTSFAFESGGDDSGNGGFAYKQSVKILELAANDLEHKIVDSNVADLVNHPERKWVLSHVLKYDQLQQLPKKVGERGRKILAMDYVVNPPAVKIYKPYYVAFMGKTDQEVEQSSLEVEKRLLHEAAHIWGYDEKASEDFALRFLDDATAIVTRPTNDITIKPDFCSCINGKSDIINDCDSFCSTKPISASPVLYLNTIIGPETSLNTKLGNLYNWCTVQLHGDVTPPQCFLTAFDGTNTISNIPVSIQPGSNSLEANIQMLSKDRTYILKIVEGKTGSNAQSKEFQLRRKSPPIPGDTRGALQVTPVNQYSCLLYGGIIDSSGTLNRTSSVRIYYYFPGNETPAPIPASGGTNPSQVVCHDEQMHPGNDSAEYPRLELIPRTALWDKADPRFVNSNGYNLAINTILEERLLREYGVSASLNLFSLINFPNRPNTSGGSTLNYPLGYYLVPFVANTGKTFCPSSEDLNQSNDPLFRLLGEYMEGTEALYVAEKEAETIQDGTNYKTIYGTTFTTQTELEKYGFYIENGFKVRANKVVLHTKTIYYYGPTNDSMDPLLKGNRNLFTVRTPDTINGNVPTGTPSGNRTTDKSIGCVPKLKY